MKFLFIISFVITKSLSQQTNKNLDILLQDSLWNKRDIYDSSHFLMVPLHYSFKNKKESEPFDRFFKLFYKYKQDYFSNKNNLQRLQFCYLLSQYLKLKVLYDSKLEIQYFDFLTSEINKFWNDYEVKSWRDFKVSKYVFKGFKDRMFWKLNTQELDDSYYNRAIVDEEKFFIAISSDLQFILNFLNLKVNEEIRELLSTVEDISFRIFSERTSRNDGEFIFQKGFWSRHRDYKYVGCYTLDCIKKGPSIIHDISEDTSHSFRMPLILNSLRDGSTKKEYKRFYKTLIRGLANQVIKKVVINVDDSDCFLMTNYLDGTNGYFRYSYSTHKSSGYGPYELAETFKLGWWIFLNDTRIKKLYKQVYNNLVKKTPCEFKFKDKTNRKRHPIYQNRFDNGLYIEITEKASKLKFNL